MTQPYHLPGEAGYRRLVIALFLASVATFAALYSTQSLIATLGHAFSIPDSHATWSVSAATLLVGIGMLIAGPLSERWGRTAVIKTSLVATALLGGACAVAPSWPVFLLLRALQGLALAGTPAVALVYLREEVDASVHPRATGLYIGGTALGGMTGRLLSGAVADLVDWRLALASVAALGGVCAVLVLLLLPAARHAPQRAGGDAVASRAWPSMRRALSAPRLIGLYVIAATSMGGFVAVYNVLGLRLIAAPYHLTVFTASLVFCVYPLGTLGAAVAGRLAERLGRPPVIVAGCLLAIAGVAVTVASPLPVIVVGVAMLTVGFFTAHGVASGGAVTLGQEHHAASQASSVYLLAYYLGSSVFGAVSGSVFSGGDWSAVALMVAALFAVAAGIAGSVAVRAAPRRLLRT